MTRDGLERNGGPGIRRARGGGDPGMRMVGRTGGGNVEVRAVGRTSDGNTRMRAVERTSGGNAECGRSGVRVMASRTDGSTVG